MKRLNHLSSLSILSTVLSAGAFAVALSASPLYAQTVPPAQAPPPPVPSAPATQDTTGQFVLGADDVIEITVRNHSELDHVLTVLPDGKLTFPTVGEMQAAGKTPRALAMEIQAELEKTLNNVGVTVVVKEAHSRRVRLIGAVRQAGAIDLKPGWKLFDAVIAAGGLSARPELVSGRLIGDRARIRRFCPSASPTR